MGDIDDASGSGLFHRRSQPEKRAILGNQDSIRFEVLYLRDKELPETPAVRCGVVFHAFAKMDCRVTRGASFGDSP